MGLQITWYIIIAFFWTGFFILEGFDLGVGVLHGVVGKTDLERRVAINSIGPYWDGNEVWLIVAGASTFAAFPSWYATMFSALYLALMLVILALIARGVSFEYRGKVASPRWRATWDWSLTIGSALLPVLLGVALGDLLAGLPINQNGDFTGSFLRPPDPLRLVGRRHPPGVDARPWRHVSQPQDHGRGAGTRPAARRTALLDRGARRAGLRHLDPPAIQQRRASRAPSR